MACQSCGVEFFCSDCQNLESDTENPTKSMSVDIPSVLPAGVPPSQLDGIPAIQPPSEQQAKQYPTCPTCPKCKNKMSCGCP